MRGYQKMNNLIYKIIIPMNLSESALKDMDFYQGFKSYFFQLYDLQLEIEPLTENTSNMVFSSKCEDSIKAIIEVLKEFGLDPIYLGDTTGDGSTVH